MAKKNKTSKAKYQKVVAKRPPVYRKFLWIGVSLSVITAALFTGNYIYKSQPTDVLGTSSSNPCAAAHCGAGGYCGGQCGVRGSNNTVYYCSCPNGQKSCHYASVPQGHSACSIRCQKNPSGSDYCINKVNRAQPRLAVNVSMTPPDHACNAYFYVSWKAYRNSTPIDIAGVSAIVLLQNNRTKQFQEPTVNKTSQEFSMGGRKGDTFTIKVSLPKLGLSQTVTRTFPACK